MTEDSIERIVGWPPGDMPSSGGGDPESVMLCVLEVSFSDGRLGFYYSRILRFERDNMMIGEAIDKALGGHIPVDVRPIDSSGYRDSTLSLNNMSHDYIVFVLGESSQNLAFPGVRPFSQVSGTKNVFYNATTLSARRAYFIANNTVYKPRQFNIHLNIAGSGKNVIPMILDPDVGHPGGNGGKA